MLLFFKKHISASNNAAYSKRVAWQQLATAYLVKIQMLAVFQRLLERPLPVTKIYLYFSTVEFPSFMTCLRHLLGISLLLLFF